MIPRFQRHLVFFLGIVLSVSITLFRMDTWFTTSWVGVWVFKALVLLNPVLLAIWLGQVFRSRWWVWLALFGLLEGGIYGYIRWLGEHGHGPARGYGFFRNMVLFMHRNVVQYDPSLSQFDPQLYYTLKQDLAHGTFRNLEYEVGMRANRLGVRDDDTSLRHPRVIFLGDSFTMGWGVPDSASFASRLERKLACKTLNAGVSSYGTAREHELLKRIQTDSCKLLVLQYCTNDDIENDELTRLKYRFHPARRDVYQGYVFYNAMTSGYYPFKFLFLVVKTAISYAWAGKPQWVEAPKPRSVAASSPPFASTVAAPLHRQSLVNFFAIVQRIRHQYQGPILLFNLEGTVTAPAIIREFAHYLRQHPTPGIYLCNVASVLSRDDYYVFDDHITASGHEKVADCLYETIGREGLLP